MLFALVARGVTGAWSCGPEWPPYYLAFGNEALVLDLPISVLGDQPIAEERQNSADSWDTTLDVDLTQLMESIGGNRTDPPVVAYETARKVARAPLEARSYAERYRYYPDPPPPDNVPPMPTRDELHGVPQEFMLYLRGTQAFYREDYPRAIAWWSRILALPEGERRCRSTWATFMMGKAYLHVDPRSAISFFEATRALVAAGYANPLDLAHASIGWQANAEDRLGHYFEAAWLYGVRGDFLSQKWTMKRAFTQCVVDERFLTDPFVREHTLALLERERLDPTVTRQVYQLAVQAAPAMVEGLPGRLAHRLYRQGEFDAAAEWVALASPDDFNARWVQSKLLLRAGDIAQGISILQELVRDFPTFTAHMSRKDVVVANAPANPLCGDLGVLLLGREDFVASLDILARGGYFPDAAYVAECVLTEHELQTYLESHRDDPELRQRVNPENDFPPMTAYDYLSYVCARRLARAGDWRKACEWYPDFATAPMRRTWEKPKDAGRVVDIAGHVLALQDPVGDRDSHAKSLMEMATLLRVHGMELMGTECGPDWGLTAGSFVDYLKYWSLPPRISRPNDVRRFAREDERPDDTIVRWANVSAKTLNLLDASAEESRRFDSSRPNPDLTFHYRYRASDLMWEAASQLPNNDKRTAQALWYGGTWLADRDPKAADRFYKALVRRCRKLPIGREADALRWFPPNPNWTE